MKKNQIFNESEVFNLCIGKGSLINILNDYIHEAIIKDNTDLKSNYISIVSKVADEETDSPYEYYVVSFLNKEVEEIYKKYTNAKNINSVSEMVNNALTYYLGLASCSEYIFDVSSCISGSGYHSYSIALSKEDLIYLLESKGILLSSLKKVASIEMNISLDILDALIENYTNGELKKFFTDDQLSTMEDDSILTKYIGKECVGNEYILTKTILAKELNIESDYISITDVDNFFRKTGVSAKVSFETFLSLYSIDILDMYANMMADTFKLLSEDATQLSKNLENVLDEDLMTELQITECKLSDLAKRINHINMKISLSKKSDSTK